VQGVDFVTILTLLIQNPYSCFQLAPVFCFRRQAGIELSHDLSGDPPQASRRLARCNRSALGSAPELCG
jgi:hypothetical protein